MAGSKVEIKAFAADLDYLYEILAFVREEAEKAGFTPPDISKVELAAEEALVNIMQYGYPSTQPGVGSIDVECAPLNDGGIRITLRDQGVPYNPLDQKKTVDPKAPLEERTLGGYGVFFIVNLMDEVTYKREDNSNVLTMIKYL